jgi:hypothetical protein
MMKPRARSRIVAARARANDESVRADRAAQIAQRHEQLQRDGLPALAAFHEGMARTHRRMEQVHQVAARMHRSFAERLEAWNDAVGAVRPTFIGSVADAVGAGSAAVALFDTDMGHALIATSDTTARVAQDLEFIVGEGPMLEATDGMCVVAAAGTDLPARWPQYGPAVAGLGVAAVWAVPLTQQHACLGALAVFDPPRTSSSADLTPFQAIAGALTRTLLLDVQHGNLEDGLARSPLIEEADDRSVVHQAAGIVAVQQDCDLGTALALIRARAFAEDARSATVAHQILRGELRLA